MIRKINALLLTFISSALTFSLFGQGPIQYTPPNNQTEFEQIIVESLRANDFFSMTTILTQGQFGNSASVASFNNAEFPLGMEDGLILTNANVNQFSGGNTATSAGGSLGIPGGDNLSLLAGVPTMDQSSIQLSFIPSQEEFTLDYVFASEEYCDFVGSAFNDVMGIFLAGPGIAGPYTLNGMPAINLAEFQNGNGDFLPVNINNINNVSNPTLYVDNNIASTSTGGGSCPSVDVSNNQFTALSQFDGWTVPLEASYNNLQIGETYYLEIAIADGVDQIFGSGIYLAGGSLNAGRPDASLTANAGIDRVISCNENTLTLGTDNTSFGAVYTHTWFDEANNILSNEPFLEVNQAGEFSLEVTNTLTTESVVDMVRVVDNRIDPAVSINVVGVINCITPTVTIAGLSDAVNSDYSWQGPGGVNIASGSTATDITVDLAGEYCLTVTDLDNGCTSTTCVFVVEDLETPTVEIGLPEVLNCALSSVLLDATGSDAGQNFRYTWSNNGVTIGTDNILEVNFCGVYVLEVENTDNGCISSQSVEVVCDQNIPSAVIANPGLLTSGGDLILNTFGSSEGAAFSYLWTSTNGNIVSGANSLTPTVNQPGTYCFTVFNTENLCESTSCVEVQQAGTSSVIADAGPDQSLNCNNSSFVIGGANTSIGQEFTYEWTFQGAVIGNTPLIEVSSSGTYTLTVTNTLTNEQVSDTVTISSTFEFIGLNVTSSGNLDCNNMQTSLDVFTELFYFEETSTLWTTLNGSIISDPTQNTIDVDQPGSYTVVVTNLTSGCTGTSTIDVLSDFNTPSVFVDILNFGMLTCDNPTISILGITNIDPEDASFLWTSSDGSIITDPTQTNIEVNDCGTYTLTVTDLTNGCTTSSTATPLCNNDAPIVSIDQPVNIELGQTIQLDATASSVGPIFLYTWTTDNGNVASGGNTLTPTIDQPGVYCLEVLNDDSGCTEVACVVVQQGNVSTVVADAGFIDDLTCDIIDVALDGSNSSVGSEFSYAWTNALGFVISTELIVSVTDAGIYTLTVTNTQTGEVASDTVEVFENRVTPSVFVDILNFGMLTCDNPTISILGITNIDPEDASFLWTSSDGSIITDPTQTNIEVNDCGTYTLTVTDLTNGCTTSSTATPLCNNDAPIVSIDQPANIELGQTIQLDATASSVGPIFLYAWTTDNGNVTSGGNTLTPTVDQPGVYCLEVLNAESGCTEVACVEVQQENSAMTDADAGPSQTLTCNNPAVTLDGSNSSTGSEFTYSWTDSSGFEISTNIQVSVSEPGEYILTVTNTQTGEATSDAVEVNIDIDIPSVELAVAAPGLITCEFNEITVTLATDLDPANASYQWEGPNIVTDPALQNITVDEAGAYVVVVTNLSNGCTSSASIEVESSINDLNIGTTSTISCDGASQLLDPSTVYMDFYIGEPMEGVWVKQDGLQIGDFPVATATMTGTYTFIGVNPTNFCEIIITYDIIILQELSVDAGMDQDLTCAGQELVLDATTTPAGLSALYSWTLNDTLLVGNAASITVTESGRYIVLAFDLSTGCTTQDTVLVGGGSDTFLTLDILTTDVTCFGANDGSLVPNFTGGVEPIVVFSDVPITGDLSPGIYTITAMDANDCTVESTVEILEPDMLNLDFELTPDGDLMGLVFGGVPPYTYQWSTGSDSVILVDPLFNFPYTLTITDANDCMSTLDIMLQTNAVGGIETAELNVYPNPTSDIVVIHQEGIIGAIGDIKLVDVQGRVLTVNHTVQDKDHVRLDMRSLPSGIYFLSLMLDDKLYHQKVIVH